MSIKIVLPDGKAPKAGNGTKIFTEDGTEIKGVERCIIDIASNEAVTAHLIVAVRDIENLEQVAGHVHISGIYPEECEHEEAVDRINQLRPSDS
ncbi:hypothetical protein [Marinobacter sp. NSM]|uniref:hypothetical protein n=1 Tax=Marinobacter sp. NSM TaxID=3458004 RepID=UPI004035370E